MVNKSWGFQRKNAGSEICSDHSKKRRTLYVVSDNIPMVPSYSGSRMIMIHI